RGLAGVVRAQVEVVAMGGDVDAAEGDRGILELAEHTRQAPGEHIALAHDSDQDHVLGAAVALHDLVRDARQRAPNLVGVHHRGRSEEHTSELQSLAYLVCRLLLEKKNYK